MQKKYTKEKNIKIYIYMQKKKWYKIYEKEINII